MVGFRPAWVWLGTNGLLGGRFLGTEDRWVLSWAGLRLVTFCACDAGKMVFFTPS